jgi:hypothetical protein
MRATIRLCCGLMLTLMIYVSSRAAEPGATPGNRTTTPDGRFNTPCDWRGGRELCIVSFYRLIANPERYHGKLIAVTGYLRMAAGNVVLFPNELSFTGEANGEGCRVQLRCA